MTALHLIFSYPWSTPWALPYIHLQLSSPSPYISSSAWSTPFGRESARASQGQQGHQETGSEEGEGPHGWESPGRWRGGVSPYLWTCEDEAEPEGTVRAGVVCEVVQEIAALAVVPAGCSMVSQLPQGLACVFSVSFSAD